MKKIIILFVSLILLGCQQPNTIIEENYYLENNTEIFLNKVVFPEPVTRSYSEFTSVQDWENGIMYKENAKTYDGIIHILDLGYLTNYKQALVYLEVKVIDHGYNYFLDTTDDSSSNIYIREKNSLAQWQTVNPRFNQYVSGLLVLTDETGKIEWYHEHNWNYWDNPTCDPGFEIYKWEKITITAKWLVVGLTIK